LSEAGVNLFPKQIESSEVVMVAMTGFTVRLRRVAGFPCLHKTPAGGVTVNLGTRHRDLIL
jgi:hypothetical protein